MKKLILFFAFTCGVTFFTLAQSTHKVRNTQVKQTVRIAQGVGNGELTRRETNRLVRQQKHIQKEKRFARADGVVTKRERAHIGHEQKHANRSIYRQKHNTKKRF